MNKSRYSVLLVLLVAAVVSVGVGPPIALIVSNGLHHVQTASILRQAKLDWQSGRILESIHKYLTAVRMIIEGGIRSQLALPYLRESAALRQQGKLIEALNACATAVRILGGYDDEGGVSYHCTMIENQLNGTPTPISPAASTPASRP